MIQQTRKQREIADRHRLFIDVAQSILSEEGYQALSMDRIAELAEYSKGTVYQHFPCKEEIVVQLCNIALSDLSGYFQKASEFPGNNRERLLAVFFAHDLFAKVNPSSFSVMQSLGGTLISDKVKPETLTDHRAMEAELIARVSRIVTDAIEAGELTLTEEINPIELVFSLWSLSYGGQIIQTYEMPLEELGIRNAGNALTRAGHALLDGMAWQPLYADFDYTATLSRIRSEVFAEEITRLAEPASNSGAEN